MINPLGTVLAFAIEGLSLSEEERNLFSSCQPSGITLFKRNVQAPQQIKALIQDVQLTRPNGAPPLIIAIDQEGGRVSRLNSIVPDLGPPLNLEKGELSTAALKNIQNYGRDLGRSLLHLGINVDFAPVVDILSKEENIAIGDRCFGREPEAVSERAGAFLVGLESSGVKGCLKHFPGQGDATADTHEELAVVNATKSLMVSRELIPYTRLLPTVGLVMVSHCLYPNLSLKPASRSPDIVHRMLRDELKYQGVIVSDDMNMGAIPQEDQTWKDSIVASIMAGVDLILVCEHQAKCQMAYDGLQESLKRDSALGKRLDESANRIMKFRRSLVC